jgi:enamine deaminase RidA (YjgF/YER057c/UK114 family)
VRTRIYLTPEADFDEVGRAHGALFREIRPVNTTVIVHSLVDPRWLLEIEVDAVIAGNHG